MTIGGATFIYRGIDQDYNFIETIKCLQECTDKVCVVVIQSEDGTLEAVKDVANDKTQIVVVPIEDWNNRQGRTKLSFYQNLAMSHLDTDYNFLLQCDEILHEKCYEYLRKAVETGKEGFLVKRIHLWHSPYLQIEVPIHRMPAGINIIRLSKKKYQSYDDGENIEVPQPNSDFIEEIRIYHMGFVRDKRKMVVKCNHIQKDIFLIEPDAKLNGMEIFDPTQWFDPEVDLIPIQERLPAIIEDWAKKRI